MKGKKLILGALLIGVMAIFTGCGEDKLDNRFYMYEKTYKDNYGNDYQIVVDKEESVLYIRTNGSMTPMLDGESGKVMKDNYDWKNKRTIEEPKVE